MGHFTREMAHVRDEPACKPDSVTGPESPVATIHLAQPLPADSCDLPADHRAGRSTAQLTEVSFLDLAPGGVYLATTVTCRTGGLLHRRFTLTRVKRAVCFLWHLPAGRPGWPLATTLPYGVRTFLDVRNAAAARPTHPASGYPSARNHELFIELRKGSYRPYVPEYEFVAAGAILATPV